MSDTTPIEPTIASPDETAAAFGRWLSHQLWVRKLSQQDVSRRTGLSASRLSYIIKGVRSLRTREMAAICDVLEVTVVQAMTQATACPHEPLNICRDCGAAL